MDTQIKDTITQLTGAALGTGAAAIKHHIFPNKPSGVRGTKRPPPVDVTPAVLPPKRKKMSPGNLPIGSFSDSSSSTEATMSKREPNTGDEVSVRPPPAKIAKTIADYTTIRLPWFERGQGTLTNAVWNEKWNLRLNSIQDPSVNFTAHRPKGYKQ